MGVEAGLNMPEIQRVGFADRSDNECLDAYCAVGLHLVWPWKPSGDWSAEHVYPGNAGLQE